MYRKETAEKEHQTILIGDTESGNPMKKGLVQSYGKVDSVEAALECGNLALGEILQKEQSTPAWKVGMMFIVTGGMLVLTILKGGGSLNPLNITCGSLPYWVITLSALPFVFTISIIARCHLVKIYHQKLDCGYNYVEGDVEWNEWNTIKYPAICSIAGLCAGMFGIGGGIVKGPLMLEMGVLPEVTSATSATMILFTAAAATVSYLLFESLNTNYGVVCFILGFVNTLIGQKAVNVLVKKYGRSSIIVLLIATIVAMSAVAMSLESSGTLMDLFNGTTQPSPSLCSSGAV